MNIGVMYLFKLEFSTVSTSLGGHYSTCIGHDDGEISEGRQKHQDSWRAPLGSEWASWHFQLVLLAWARVKVGGTRELYGQGLHSGHGEERESLLPSTHIPPPPIALPASEPMAGAGHQLTTLHTCTLLSWRCHAVYRDTINVSQGELILILPGTGWLLHEPLKAKENITGMRMIELNCLCLFDHFCESGHVFCLTVIIILWLPVRFSPFINVAFPKHPWIQKC